MVNTVLEFLLRPQFIYPGTFILLVAAGLGLPIPEELPIVLAGAATGHSSEVPKLPEEFFLWSSSEVTRAVAGYSPTLPFPASLPWSALHESSRIEVPPLAPLPKLHWWILLPICILGVVVSDGMLYSIGRFGGQRLLNNRWATKLVPAEKRARIEENFHRHGILVLLFARFLPAIRSPIFIMAGVLRLPFTRFVLADGIYALPGVSLLFFLSYWFGDQARELLIRIYTRVDHLKPLLILLALAAVGAYLAWHFWRHPFATGDPGEGMPIVGEQIAAKMEQLSHADLSLDRAAPKAEREAATEQTQDADGKK
jgi:membrane protein DedA with SNARE-associated domain